MRRRDRALRRLRRGRGRPRARGRAARGGPRLTTCPSAARTATGSSPSHHGAAALGRPPGEARARPGRDGHPERQRRRERARLPARDPLAHRGLDRQRPVCETAEWLAAVALLDGVRSVALFCEADGDGAALAEALALCAEREVGVAVLKVGESAAGARAASAHTGALAGDQRVFRALIEEAGGAWAEDFHDLLELAKALAEPRARPRGDGGLAVLTCSGGDSGRRRPTRRRASASTCPSFGAGDGGAARGAAPRRGDDRQPARLHGDDLGRRAAARRDRRDGRRRPGDRPAAPPLRPPARRRRLVDRGAARADRRRRRRPRGASIVASTLPDLLDPGAARELADAGLPAIAGPADGAACARGHCALRPEIRRGCGRSPPQAAAPERRAARTAGSERWRRRRSCAHAGSRCRRGGSPRTSRRREGRGRDRLAGCAEALRAGTCCTRPRRGRRARGLATRTSCAPRSNGCAAIPEADGAAVLVEEMVEPGVELVVAARADGVVPALVIGLGGIWTEALDDVADNPAAGATPSGSSAALRLICEPRPCSSAAAVASRSRSRELCELAARDRPRPPRGAPRPARAQPRDRHRLAGGRGRRPRRR